MEFSQLPTVTLGFLKSLDGAGTDLQIFIVKVG
jgi:hypothetical protein